MEPQAECWVKWEINASPSGTTLVLTQTLKHWAKLSRPTVWDGIYPEQKVTRRAVCRACTLTYPFQTNLKCEFRMEYRFTDVLNHA
jgi:hypothetical protein